MMMSRLPLDGIRVIDFSRVLAGPLCSALLGDLGADVIKIEPPAGDDYRAIGPFANGESGLFGAMNRNKRSVVIDMKTADGRALAQSLCADADVVVENFRPGVADRLGIGYTALSARNPALVYASVSGFGQTGPESSRPAYDIILQAMCGLMDATGAPDGEPTLVGDSVSDVVSGIFASWGVLAGLVARDRTGQGTHVDVSMFDATMSLTAALVARYATTGVAPRRVGNRHPTSAPFGAYRAADGHFVVAVLNNKLFGLLADTIGHPTLVDDARFASDTLRCEHEAALRACIERWSATRSVDEVNETLGTAGIPVAPIRNIQEALESEQARTRRLLVDTVAADGSPIRLPAQPLKFSAYPDTRTTRAPQLGEHTRAVLERVLGLDDAAISALVKAGVVHAAAETVVTGAAASARQTETRQEMNDA
ncbi:CaiB/BaiF CoA-transferase family protein [Burkholderia sp. Bp8998]|uniref:CaiB/BaiF CoA transferase family protein n=1 Tax=Burkholderia sp. Bp8998 TaxID=2184557 RepID=UPI000F5A7592|nr:CoA transferase [Burkholderia sp. Bp8998]RQS10261.1 CoA transferase [Burkholderia sp. Bp8998]